MSTTSLSLRRLLTLATLAGALSSCAPYVTDPYYTQTAATRADPAYVNPGDIVGTWHDAWVWNGHKYRHTYTFYPDYTGLMRSENEWRDGGSFSTESDLQWAYDAHGGWNIRMAPSRVISGSGRAGEEPFEFKIRKVNGRIYYDQFKRTWVNDRDAALVSEKDRAAGLSYQGRAELKQGLQNLQQTLQALE